MATRESRFLENKVKKPKNVELGPRVTLDDERCILCSRCIRFCQEIAKDDVLGFVDRGSHTVLTAHPGQATGKQLFTEHGRYLSGRRAHLHRFSFQDAGLVPEGNKKHLHQLRHGLQHRHRNA